MPRRSAGAVLAKRGVPVRISIWLLALSAVALPQANPGWYAGLKWRNIGPFRGGRVSAVSGVSSQPGVYYMGTPGGGIWKTVDGGTVWTPVFDQVSSVSSIGALAVAPSDPNVVYVGTGDVVSVGGSVNEGDGLYKSTDAGVTWHPDGLGQARHIVALLVDPHDPDVVLAAALGDRYSPSAARGIFRTSNGGRSWQETLDAGERIGAISLAWAGDNPSVVFAAMPAMSWRGGAAAQRGEDVPV
ncbi:MAG TPA: hypothetical protein VGS58_04130, partial [Candidatus Sulfopaludibacter sp.]|nr:hypothetical protein [Candidatus Sulfopaludibacter sp.]